VSATADVEVVARDGKRRRADRRDLFALRKQFPPRPDATSWDATTLSRGRVLALALAEPFAFGHENYQAEVRRGVSSVLDWLACMPGKTGSLD
jgi:hypothetical protein